MNVLKKTPALAAIRGRLAGNRAVPYFKQVIESLAQFTRLAVPHKYRISQADLFWTAVTDRRLNFASPFLRQKSGAVRQPGLWKPADIRNTRSDVAAAEAGVKIGSGLPYYFDRKPGSGSVPKVFVPVE